MRHVFFHLANYAKCLLFAALLAPFAHLCALCGEKNIKPQRTQRWIRKERKGKTIRLMVVYI
jgi:hypothetical protein